METFAHQPTAVPRRRRKPPPRPLDEDLILSWADAHFDTHGIWPKKTSGPIGPTGADTWAKVDSALRLGLRGLLPGSSLALLLQERRNAFHHLNQSRLSISLILDWADNHYERHGSYPTCEAGVIDAAPTEQWFRIDRSLRDGRRGLPRGSSLANLLQEYRGRRNHCDAPPLSEALILAWADEHYDQSGQWPTRYSGTVHSATDENWSAIDMALLKGVRSLDAGSSLGRLLEKYRGRRNHLNVPRLDIEQVTGWIQSYALRHGRCPTRKSGTVDDAPGETWSAVNYALACGTRGLPGGSSLARLGRSVVANKE